MCLITFLQNSLNWKINMWLTEDQINRAKNVIDVYGEDTVAGQFAKEILKLSTPSDLFGEFNMPLTLNEVPPCVHDIGVRESTTMKVPFEYKWKRLDKED